MNNVPSARRLHREAASKHLPLQGLGQLPNDSASTADLMTRYLFNTHMKEHPTGPLAEQRRFAARHLVALRDAAPGPATRSIAAAGIEFLIRQGITDVALDAPLAPSLAGHPVDSSSIDPELDHRAHARAVTAWSPIDEAVLAQVPALKEGSDMHDATSSLSVPELLELGADMLEAAISTDARTTELTGEGLDHLTFQALFRPVAERATLVVAAEGARIGPARYASRWSSIAGNMARATRHLDRTNDVPLHSMSPAVTSGSAAETLPYGPRSGDITTILRRSLDSSLQAIRGQQGIGIG